jgi:hypothetical protein
MKQVSTKITLPSTFTIFRRAASAAGWWGAPAWEPILKTQELIVLMAPGACYTSSIPGEKTLLTPSQRQF